MAFLCLTMKVIKLDIIQTPMDVDYERDVVDFAIYNGLREARMLKKGEYPPLDIDMASVKRERFQVRKVKRPYEDFVERYLVKIDDYNVFEDLIAISNADLEKTRDDAFRAGVEKGFNDGAVFSLVQGRAEGLKTVRNLGLFARIFKRF